MVKAQDWYKLQEAWKQYFDESIIRDDIIRPIILQLWHRGKINGYNAYDDTFNFELQNNIIPYKILKKRVIDEISKAKMNVYVTNNEGVVVDNNYCFTSPFNFEIGTDMMSIPVADTSYHMCFESQTEYFEIVGAEHYYKILHDYYEVTRICNIHGREYFITFTMHLDDYNDEIQNSIINLLELITRTNEIIDDRENELYKTTVVVSNILGHITNIVVDELSIFKQSLSLIDVYSKVDFSKIRMLEQQILSTNLGDLFVLEPICSIGKDYLLHIESLEIYLSKLRTTYKPSFSSMPAGNKVDFNDIEKRRLTALIKSKSNIYINNSTEMNVYEGIKCLFDLNDIKHLTPINMDDNEGIIDELVAYIKEPSLSNFFTYHSNEYFYLYNFTSLEINLISKLIDLLQYDTVYNVSFIIDVEASIISVLPSEQQKIFDEGNLKVINIKFTNNYNSIHSNFNNKVNKVNSRFTYEINNNTNNLAKITNKKTTKSFQNTDLHYRNFDLKEVEKSTIISAIIESDKNVSRAAALLGISRSTFYRKIKEYGIRY